MPQTQTVSYLKKNAADLSLDETIALMKLISISKQSSQQGALSFEEMGKLISEA